MVFGLKISLYYRERPPEVRSYGQAERNQSHPQLDVLDQL